MLRSGGVAFQEHLADGEVVVGVGVVRLALHDLREVGNRLEIVVGHDRIDESHHEVGPAAFGVQAAGGDQFLLGEVFVAELEQFETVTDHLIRFLRDPLILLLGDPFLSEPALLLFLPHLPFGQLLLCGLAQIGRHLRIGKEDLVDLHRLGGRATRLRVGLELFEGTERSRFLFHGLGVGIGA